MIRNRIIAVGLILTAVLMLSACSGQSAALAPTAAPVQPSVAQATTPSATTAPGQPAATQPVKPTATQPAKPAIPLGDLIRINEGGEVTFEVKPLKLGSGASTLDFDLVMNTHSVDLGFDLRSMSVLKTDTGAEIAPSAYEGGSGHHVKGKLSFPADKLPGPRH